MIEQKSVMIRKKSKSMVRKWCSEYSVLQQIGGDVTKKCCRQVVFIGEESVILDIRKGGEQRWGIIEVRFCFE